MINLIKTMLIVNVTPDSFSDGNDYFKYSDFSSRLTNIINTTNAVDINTVDIIDIGAHSTAPFNKNISYEEELKRFENSLIEFVKFHQGWIRPNIAISIDTYRPKIFKSVYERVKEICCNQNQNPKIKFIWNDISGIIDDEVIDLLSRKENEDVSYVLSYNVSSQTGDREIGVGHMQFAKDMSKDELLYDIVDFFNKGIEFFSKRIVDFNRSNIFKRVIFDPCFGFAKTRAENQILLANDNLKQVISSFPPEISWLIAISRKSFLREKSELGSRDPAVIEKIEKIHLDYLYKWMREMPQNHLIFRVHDLNVAQSVINEHK
ncbi:MAG: dihydropteroate synthase [Oligoflexia bacterium]|nr:dihydropteroate synthase [Oligoflexia bacterium]